MMPKLIGMFTLPFPRIRRLPDSDQTELVRFVATDTDGQQWGLVELNTPIPPLSDGPRGLRVSMGARRDYVRWIRFDAVPFVPEEVITSGPWK